MESVSPKIIIFSIALLFYTLTSFSQGQPSILIRNIEIGARTGGPAINNESLNDILILGLSKKSNLKISKNGQSKKTSNADFILDGNASFTGNNFFVSLKLYRGKTDSLIFLPPIYGKYDDFFKQFNFITDQIIDRVDKASTKFKKTIAVLSSKIVGTNSKIVDDEIIKLILNSLTNKLNDNNLVKVKLFENLKVEPLSLLRDKLADCIVRIEFQYDKDLNVILTPFFFTQNIDNPLRLSSIVISATLNYNDQENAVIQDFNELFKFLINSKGEWNLPNIDTLAKTKTLSDTDLINAARRFYKADSYLPTIFYANKYLQNKSEAIEPHIILADVRIKQDRTLDALFELNKVLSVDPNNREARYLKGAIYYNQGEYSKAIEDFKTIYKLDSNYARKDGGNINLSLAQTYLSLDSIDKAIPFLAKSNSATDFDKTQFALGLAYYKKGLYTRSLSEYAEYYKRHPESEQAKIALSNNYYQLGLNSYENKSYKPAYDSFLKSQEYYEDPLSNWYLLYSLNRMEKIKSADSLFNIKLKSGKLGDYPYYMQAYDLLLVYNSIKELRRRPLYEDKIVELFGKHLEINKADTVAIYLLGNSYVKFKDFKRGVKYLEQASQLDKNNISYKLDLAEASIMNNDPSKVQGILPEEYVSRLSRTAANGDEKSNCAIALYLKCISNLVLSDQRRISNEQADKSYSELVSFLRDDFSVTNWIFESFEDWLETYNGASLSKIGEITDRLKNKLTYGVASSLKVGIYYYGNSQQAKIHAENFKKYLEASSFTGQCEISPQERAFFESYAASSSFEIRYYEKDEKEKEAANILKENLSRLIKDEVEFKLRPVSNPSPGFISIFIPR